MKTFVGFGEIMARLVPPNHLRLRQAMPGTLNVTFAGAEANVMATIAMMGGQTRYVTALPENDIADACLAVLNSMNIDTRYVIRTSHGRVGLFFVETGANQRPSKVIYDRDGASVTLVAPEHYLWSDIFEGANWLHISGITPALSRLAADAALIAAKEAKATKVTVSCDLNFRKNLWNWKPDCSRRELAEKTMKSLLPYVDLVLANEQDAEDVLGIKAGQTDVESGRLAIEKYPDVAREIVRQFPNVSQVAITLRQSISADHNNWAAMLYDGQKQQAVFAPLDDEKLEPYQIRNIVDRVGGGDAFAGGLIFALATPELNEPQTALSYATAASCLAHSIAGDFNFSSRSEVEALMQGFASGRVVR